MASEQEVGWTVPPEKGIELLEEGRKGAYALLERVAPQVLEGDSFLGALSSAHTGYANALREVEELRAALERIKARALAYDGFPIDANDDPRSWEYLDALLLEARGPKGGE